MVSLALPALSIVVPAFDEETTIGATLDDALAVGADVAGELEVVVCNDGSRDRTAEIVRGHRDPRIRLVDRARNLGIEASMRELYGAARHDWVFLMSADRQWPMTALVAMAAAATDGADFVIGVRANKREIYTPYRRALSWSYERLVRALGAPGGDPGSIKLARRALLDCPLVATGVFAEGERMIRAARGGARVAEVAVEFRPRRAGKATGARAPTVLRAIVDAARVTSSVAVGWPRPVARR